VRSDFVILSICSRSWCRTRVQKQSATLAGTLDSTRQRPGTCGWPDNRQTKATTQAAAVAFRAVKRNLGRLKRTGDADATLALSALFRGGTQRDFCADPMNWAVGLP